jgi:hypothetical protein
LICQQKANQNISQRGWQIGDSKKFKPNHNLFAKRVSVSGFHVDFPIVIHWSGKPMGMAF